MTDLISINGVVRPRTAEEQASWEAEQASNAPTLEQVRTAKLAALSAKRYAIETGGTTFNGLPVRTDRETSGIITAAFVSAMADQNFLIENWKIADGVFITLDAATIFTLAGAIRAHVQSAFNREAELSAEIAALETVEALNAFDIDENW